MDNFKVVLYLLAALTSISCMVLLFRGYARSGARLLLWSALCLHLGGRMIDFLAGAVTFGFSVASVFFLRFWRKTADRLFLAFSAAFGLLAVNQVLAAVLDKNLSGRRKNAD